jgi:mRNA-degrading endonuclease RelE of RelBE toxin-antitoxin system
MPFEILLSENFERRVKKLSKKYHSLEDDLLSLIDSLELNPTQGVSLGQDCYKIRLNITSKKAGKRGGARVITCVKIINEQIVLLTIIDKSEQETISEKELDALLKKVFDN